MNTIEDTLKLNIEALEVTSFFDCLGDILLKVSGGKLDTYNGFAKHFSKVMICRYLSMKLNLIDYAEYLNKVQYKLSDSQFYQLAYSLIPKQKSGFIKYIKKQKKNKNNKIDNNSLNNTKSTLSIFDL